jgi:RNA polymerase sigma-70 factor (ECF subfamily)
VDRKTEDVLIRRIQNGNFRLFERIIEEYQNSLHGFLYKIVKNSDDARDLCQDTFFKAYKYIRSYDGRAKFSTWLFKIGYNLTLNFLKRKKKQAEILKQILPPIEPDRKGKELEVKEIRIVIDQIMQEIQHSYRAALHLFYREEKSYSEIAAIMKVPINTVKSSISRGKKAIRKKLINDYQLENFVS